MRRLATVCYALALAVWAGGGAIYTFVLTPAIFAGYPRDAAGGIVGTMMPHYFATLLAATAIATAAFAALWRAWPPRLRALGLALLLASLASQAYVRWGLYPEILAVKAQVASFETDPDAPARRRFRSLHGTSMLLNVLAIAEGAALLALFALPARGPAAGAVRES